jgi:membrane protein insertase Oxa1/YidC/SpoIIIJ
MMKTFMKGIAVLMVPATAWFQSGVFVYWISTNCIGITQTMILRQPPIRALVGMPPLPGSAPAAGLLGMSPAQAAAAMPATGPNTDLSLSGSQVPQPVARSASKDKGGKKSRKKKR